MATGDTWTTLYAKKLLGFQALGARMRDVLRKGISDTVLGVYGQPFLLSPTVTCDISTADQCPVVGGGAAVQAVDGQGEFIYAEDGDPGLDLPFENTLNEFYNVGLYAAEFPIGVEINPRTGAYKYSATQMGIGLVAAPNSVSVGGGGLWIGVDAVCEADHDHSMRTVRVWLKNGLASPVTAVAIQDCAVQYMILEPTSLNMIHVPNSLGQAVPSTDPADYQVALLGPIVRRYDAPPSSSVLVASVKGGGAGNPPVSVTTFGVQSVVPTFARINELIEWVGVHPKIRVRAQTGEANVPQISMLDVAGVRTWTVDGTGNMVQDFRGGSTSGKVMQLTSTGDTWIQTIAGVLQLVSDVAGKAVRVQPGTGAPLEVVTSWIQGITGALTFGDANTGASLTIPLSSATDTAIDGDLPQTILGAFKAAADHQRLLKYTTGMKTGSLASAIWFLGCTAGTGRVVNVGEGYYSNNGRGVSVPAGTITTTDNATKYIYVDTVAKTFGLAATIGPDLTNTSRVVVAKVVAAAGVITEIVNVVVAGTDRGFPVNVIVSAVTTPGVHFTSLSDAIKAVGEWSAPTAGSQIRDWRIVVVGSVTESSVNLPINIPCDGITIEGCTRASAIHWGGDNPLFELNGHTDFSVSKLLGVCSNTAAVPVGQTRVLLHDNGTGDPPRFALKDLRITGGALSGLFVGRGQDFVIQNVYACNCVDFAVAVSAGGGGGGRGVPIRTALRPGPFWWGFEGCDRIGLDG